MFAVHAGIAIENARLHDQVQRLAVVEERERIGKDLHDGIIQAIYAVGLSLEDVPELVEDDGGRDEAVARVDRAIDALNLVISDIRSYILRPAARRWAGEEDAVEALARLAEELGMHAVIDLEVDLDGGAGAPAVAAARTAGRTSCSSRARRSRTSPATPGATRTALVLARRRRRARALRSRTTAAGSTRPTLPGPDAFGRHQGLGQHARPRGGHGRHVHASSDPTAPARVSSSECRRHPAPATSERAAAATGES